MCGSRGLSKRLRQGARLRGQKGPEFPALHPGESPSRGEGPKLERIPRPVIVWAKPRSLLGKVQNSLFMPFRADPDLPRTISGLVSPAALLLAAPALALGLHPALTRRAGGLCRLPHLLRLQSTSQGQSEPLTGVLEVPRLLTVTLSTYQELSRVRQAAPEGSQEDAAPPLPQTGALSHRETQLNLAGGLVHLLSTRTASPSEADLELLRGDNEPRVDAQRFHIRGELDSTYRGRLETGASPPYSLPLYIDEPPPRRGSSGELRRGLDPRSLVPDASSGSLCHLEEHAVHRVMKRGTRRTVGCPC